MNYAPNPQRIIATNIRTTAATLEAWRDLYALTYATHRRSFNAWLITMLKEGITAAFYAHLEANDVTAEEVGYHQEETST